MQNCQISSHSIVLHGRSRSVASWYSAQAAPRSTSSLVTVFFAAPVMRTVPRIDTPSTRQPMICARLSVLNRFILTIMLERTGIIKG